MKVPYVDLGAQHRGIKDRILSRIGELLDSGQFILGDPVQRFEEKVAEYCEVKHAIGVANGTDSLVLALKAFGVGAGDEVITPSHSFLASTSAIVLAGATPRFADIGHDMNIDPATIEPLINTNTKAIIVVHLTGRPADMDATMAIAEKHDLKVIEDAAQAIGATYKGKKVGGIGHVGCFSLHPLKNLAAAGDGGLITTNNDELADYLRKARNHGLVDRDNSEFWSVNSRLDAIQAAILEIKLEHLEAWNTRRREIAAKYNEAFKDPIAVPEWNTDLSPVFHAYVIQTDRRDELMEHLKIQGVDSKIHYPLGAHQQRAAKGLRLSANGLPVTEATVQRILSLPVYPELSDEQVGHVINSVQQFVN